MYRHPPQSSNQTPSFPADLKDDNVQLREENQALKNRSALTAEGEER